MRPVNKSSASQSPVTRARSTRSSSKSASAARAATRVPRATRLEKEALILAEAEQQFARFGFEGVSLDTIAAELGMSRQNILYYYASKDELYSAVLDSVLASWLASMDTLARENDPRTAIEKYVHAKLRFSQERPSGSAVFTREIMAGAPRYGEQLALNVVPMLRADVRTFERWARQGLIARVDFTHLMFVIWSSTQAYADLSTQFAVYLGKRKLSEDDFEAARALLTELVWTSLRK
jgi:TetR/AcrR family transcriptional regulator